MSLAEERRERLARLRLYLITGDRGDEGDTARIVEAALEGGAPWRRPRARTPCGGGQGRAVGSRGGDGGGNGRRRRRRGGGGGRGRRCGLRRDGSGGSRPPLARSLGDATHGGAPMSQVTV